MDRKHMRLFISPSEWKYITSIQDMSEEEESDPRDPTIHLGKL